MRSQGKNAGQECRARIQGKKPRQEAKARSQGKKAGQECRARIQGKKPGEEAKARSRGKNAGGRCTHRPPASFKGVLFAPVLYISYFLKKNRMEYYDRMTEVHNNGNYEQWVKFFLQAISESAEDAVDKIQKLSALHAVRQEAAVFAVRLFAY